MKALKVIALVGTATLLAGGSFLAGYAGKDFPSQHEFSIGGEVANAYDFAIVEGIDAARFASAGIAIPNGWNPTKAEDIPLPWPESWIKRFGQAFSPHRFAQNVAAVRGAAARDGLKPIYRDVLTYLDHEAQKYTQDLPNGDLTVFYDFAIPIHGETFPKGHGGAFGTTMTALGYMHLFQITKEKRYMNQAERLLDGALSTKAEHKGWSVDDKGYFWLEEVSYNDQNVGVFNGHIYAMIAYYTFREMTGTSKYDDMLRAAATTMAHWLPLQRRPQGFFGYHRDHLDNPDYGQERAVILAEFLCHMTKDPALCGISEAFRQSFAVWGPDAGKLDKD